ncbi:MAG: aldehyde dehydrogenase family protein [Ilumatobacteraceae bacterium]
MANQETSKGSDGATSVDAALSVYASAYSGIGGLLTSIAARRWPLIIGGESCAANGDATYATFDPATGQVLAHVADANAHDVDRAVIAAEQGARTWRNVAPRDRAKLMRRFADVLRGHADELGLLDALDGGSPITSMRADVHWAAEFLDTFADWSLSMKGEVIPSTADGLHYTKLEPYGVVARIIPFNHPVMFAAGKLAAPLLAGNAIILKPPHQAPLSAIRVGELAAEVFPAGVVNVVTGAGPATGIAIARHPGIRRIAFIGSERTGREIQRLSAEVAVKHVTLELGGKNAMVVLNDADPSAAAAGAVRGMNFTASQGESCGSNSRLLVHRSLMDDVVGHVADLVRKIRVGVPVDPATEMGALVSREHYDRVMGYIDTGMAEGATLVTGGTRPDHLAQGCFVNPTVFADVRPEMRIAQEEIFGPVISIIGFDDDDEAIRIANGVRYGLTASVWTNNLRRAHQFIDGFHAGYVWVNDSARHFAGMPFGGYKASGIGREESIEEVFSFCETKSVNINLGA